MISFGKDWDGAEEDWKQYTVTWFTTNSRVTKRIPLILTEEEKENVDAPLPPQVENQTEKARMFEDRSEITGMVGREFNVGFR